MELLKDEKYTIKLGDKEYGIPELSWEVLSAIEQEFDCSMRELRARFEAKEVTSLLSLVYVLLKCNYPEITKKEIGQQGKIGDIQPVSERVFAAIKAAESNGHFSRAGS
ncbi:MAG: hypothetical protein PHI12_08905 [Dehalococcoidales bacterium]|nr:hypothetical protein [Dehalococcoidales bacterium]